MRQTPFCSATTYSPHFGTSALERQRHWILPRPSRLYKDFQVNIQMQDSMQLKVRIQWNQIITIRNEKTLTNGSNINTLVSTHRAWEVNRSPFRGKLWLPQTLSIKGRGGEGKRRWGVMSSFVHSPGTALRRDCRFPGSNGNHWNH